MYTFTDVMHVETNRTTNIQLIYKNNTAIMSLLNIVVDLNIKANRHEFINSSEMHKNKTL